LHLVKARFETLHVTEAIFQEVVQAGAGKPGSGEVERSVGSWITAHATPPGRELHAYRRTLRLSDADLSVIALAVELNADLVLVDEQLLRRAVIERGLTVAGSGGVLVQLKHARLITEVKPHLMQALAAGLRLDDDTLTAILALAGEH